MKPDDLNFRHLLYFWAVAQEGSMTRGAERLGLSAQAISTQLGQLERQLGLALFAPQGRSLKLTESGKVVLGYADKIFQLGSQLRQSLAEQAPSRGRFSVGITDAIPKLMAFRILRGVLEPPLSARLECSEGAFDVLLGELLLNHLDMVIADRSAPERANVRFLSHKLGQASVGLFASDNLHAAYTERFPHDLTGAPFLLPAKSDPLRHAIDSWLGAAGVRPSIEGEFSDSALLKTFGRAGIGLFAAPVSLAPDLLQQYGVRPLGVMSNVFESWYAIAVDRRVQHPAWALITSQAIASLPAEAMNHAP